MKTTNLPRLLLSVMIAIVTIWVTIMYRKQFNLHTIQVAIQQAGIWAPIVFIVLYSIATIFFLPGLILTLTGGLLLGAVLGTLYNLSGAVLGSTVAFLIARYIASDWVAHKAGRKLKNLLDNVNRCRAVNSSWCNAMVFEKTT
ncbi:MAG: TVP38/TMEM64 family protein [Gammaproteobacteria bacterium]|nr:TVP38/TMEM64 family protein [Gammaproteobacteria bacterium]